MSKTRTIRAALTQTVNAYQPMPATVGELSQLEDRLDDLREANVQKHVELLHVAHEAGAQVVCFGELFTAPYFALGARDPFWFALAEDACEGPTVSRLRREAAALGVIVIAPIYELDPETQRRFNTAVVIDERGEILGCYRKTHIPEGSNEAGVFNESFYYGPGDGLRTDRPRDVSRNRFFPVFETSVGRIGVAICYDRHFAGAISSLAREGADVVFCPAVTFGSKSRRMWEMEFAVDACRFRIYVGGSNRAGQEPPWNQEFFGQSHFVGPEGTQQDLCEHPELVVCDLDLDALAAPDSAGWDFRRDARPRIYTVGFDRRLNPRDD